MRITIKFIALVAVVIVVILMIASLFAGSPEYQQVSGLDGVRVW